jgi:hypothetical protein
MPPHLITANDPFLGPSRIARRSIGAAGSIWDDDFADSSLDLTKWTTTTSGTWSITETTSLALSTDDGLARLTSGVTLGSDDFDVRIDFNSLVLTAGTTTQSGTCVLRVVLPAGNYDVCWKNSTTGGEEYGYRDAGSVTTTSSTVPSSGYLRLVRTGTSLKHYIGSTLIHTSTISGAATAVYFQSFSNTTAESQFNVTSFTLR